MIQNPTNKYAVLPEQETFAHDNQPENSLSHLRNPHQQDTLQNEPGSLVVQGEPVVINIPQPLVQESDFDDREIVHEYRDFFFGYSYRRIRKEKVAADGTKEDEDEVEVEQILFAQDLPLEEMYIWALKFNFWVGLVTWPMYALYFLYKTIRLGFISEGESSSEDWFGLIVYHLFLNMIFLGVTLWQRRLYRNALIKKDFKEGKKQLRGLAFIPIVMIFFGLMFTLISLLNYANNY